MLVAAILTAVFTGITALVGYLLYRHNRVLSGSSRPIKVREHMPRMEYVSGLRGSGDVVVGAMLYNRSDAPESVSLGPRKQRVLWPRGCDASAYNGAWIDIPARQRRVFEFRVARRDGEAFRGRRVWLLVSVELVRGKPQRFLRRLRPQR